MVHTCLVASNKYECNIRRCWQIFHGISLLFAGVHSVHVALLSEMATVEFDEQVTTSDTLTTDIASLGFDVECVAVNSASDFSKVNFKVNVAHTVHLLVAANIMYIS